MGKPKKGFARPLLDTLCKKIEDQGGDEVIFDRVVSGEMVKEIMKSYGVSRAMFFYWLDVGGEERKVRWKEARELAAFGHAEDGLELLDEAGRGDRLLTPPEVMIRRQRAEYRKWLAEKWNRKEFGGEAAVQVQINTGDLHLAALQAAGFRETKMVSPPYAEVIGEHVNSPVALPMKKTRTKKRGSGDPLAELRDDGIGEDVE